MFFLQIWRLACDSMGNAHTRNIDTFWYSTWMPFIPGNVNVVACKRFEMLAHEYSTWNMTNCHQKRSSDIQEGHNIFLCRPTGFSESSAVLATATIRDFFEKLGLGTWDSQSATMAETGH